MATRPQLYIGTAGWAIRREHGPRFAGGESVLARYATRLNAVEINSSFYRPHRAVTYARWAGSVPDDFRFAVKVPRRITHELRLQNAFPELDEFLVQTGALQNKLGPLLFQLPPKLAFDAGAARTFFVGLRARFGGMAVCEPRHASWFTGQADALLRECQISRVAADPAMVPGADEPGGWDALAYFRLHGAPRVYYENYEPLALLRLAAALTARTAAGPEAWCIFDNTALGFATANALEMPEHLARASAGTRETV